MLGVRSGEVFKAGEFGIRMVTIVGDHAAITLLVVEMRQRGRRWNAVILETSCSRDETEMSTIECGQPGNLLRRRGHTHGNTFLCVRSKRARRCDGEDHGGFSFLSGSHSKRGGYAEPLLSCVCAPNKPTQQRRRSWMILCSFRVPQRTRCPC